MEMSVDFEIIEHIATLSETNSTSKEINLVSWEDRDPKYDIRRWKSTGEPGKGVTLTEDEFDELKNVLSNMELDPDKVLEVIRDIDWLKEYYEASFAIDGEWFDIEILVSEIDILAEDDGNEILDVSIEININEQKYVQALKLANDINIWCHENELFTKAFIEKEDFMALNICGTGIITNIDLLESWLDLIETLIFHFQEDFLDIMHEETFDENMDKIHKNFEEINRLIQRFSNKEDYEDNEDYEDEEDDEEEDDDEEYDEEYDEEDDEEYDEDDEIETQRIQLDDFVVIGDSLSCVHEDHETVEIIAEIDFIDLSGEITTMETNAFYCEECGTYYIRQYDYRALLAKAGNKKIMCQIIMEEKYWNNPDSVFFTMNDESILHKLGYNLTSGLSDKQRRGILKSVINNGIRSKEEVINFLSYQIKFKRNNPKMERSIKTWEEDRDYIIGYDSPNRQRVRPQRIDVTEYRKEE